MFLNYKNNQKIFNNLKKINFLETYGFNFLIR